MKPQILSGERPLMVFLSSAMNTEMMMRAREGIVAALDQVPLFERWAFEFVPGSSSSLSDTYLSKVVDSDVVIWLVGEETTEPVEREIATALAQGKRLLVFLLPFEKRSDRTTELLERVRSEVKYVSVESDESLGNLVVLTLYDEMLRAYRNQPTHERVELLELSLAESYARCAERWQAVGLEREEAYTLAFDSDVGSFPQEAFPSPERPVVLLIGEIGVGKSLAVERHFQAAVARAQQVVSPVPVYVRAQAVDRTLKRAVLDAAAGIGDPLIEGAIVVIDGADEAGLGAASRLLSEARVLTGTWPSTTVVMTSRPIATLSGIAEAVPMPELDESNALELMGLVAQRPIDQASMWGWPASVREAIKRPLFAFLCGAYLRDNADSLPRSSAQLLHHLVSRAISDSPKSDELTRFFRSLAVLTIDRGGSQVPEGELGETLVETPLAFRSQP